MLSVSKASGQLGNDDENATLLVLLSLLGHIANTAERILGAETLEGQEALYQNGCRSPTMRLGIRCGLCQITLSTCYYHYSYYYIANV